MRWLPGRCSRWPSCSASRRSPTSPCRARRLHLRDRLPATGGHDDRHRPAATGPGRRPAQRAPSCSRCSRWSWSPSTWPRSRSLDRLLRRRAGGAPGRARWCCCSPCCSTGRSGSGSPRVVRRLVLRRPRPPLRRRRRAGLDPRAGRRGPRAARRGRRRGRLGVRGRLRPGRGRPPVRRAARGHPRRPRPAEVRTLPITYRDQEVGRVVLPARGLRSRLSRRDEQLLADLVRQAATAARTSQLADELQDSRERLVVAREEERRRIRRDLHDGLGPSLSGVVYQLESARLLVDKDPRPPSRPSPGSAVTCRTWSPTYAASCTTCARRRSTTAAWSARSPSRPSGSPTAGPAVSVEADGPRRPARRGRGRGVPHRRRGAHQRHPARARAPRHRPAAARRRATCSSRSPTTAPASPPEAQAGVGLVSLRERAAELGGRSEVTCPATGGTVVRAWLPLAHHSEGTTT